MGVLRSDRVSGLGGANAITGSTFFSTTEHFLSFDSSDINFDTGDFTVEAYVFHTGGNDDTIISDVSGWTFTYGASGNLRFYMATGSNVVDATSSFISNEWVHVAVVRSSGTLTFYQNGTAVGSHSYSHDIANNSGITYIGKYHSGVVQNFIGHISNLRVVQGTALYTGAFTPPTSRLEKTSDTVLLTCNSASNVLNEETGKSLMNENPNYPQADQPGPIASRFAPDVGEDYGTTFADGAVFDTLSYMVPPGGTTAQSNRGRGLMMGSYVSPSSGTRNAISYINIQSTGNAQDFGDLTSAQASGAAVASSTRAVYGGGWTSPGVDICYVTIATTGNAIDFGADRTQGTGAYAPGSGNATRGLFWSAQAHPAYYNTIDFVTIATTGACAEFGDIQGASGRYGGATFADPTRAVYAGGVAGATPTALDIIDRVQIATQSDGTDFGDLTTAKRYTTGASDSTRGVVYAGGSPADSSVIEYITIQGSGGSTDFGDATVARAHIAGMSNSIRGVFAGGVNPSLINVMDSIIFQTTGNAVDWGDYVVENGVGSYSSGTSDSHGGIA